MKYSTSNKITYEIDTGDGKTYKSITNTAELDIGMIILIVVLLVLAYEIAYHHTFLVVPQYIWVLFAILIGIYIVVGISGIVLYVVMLSSLKGVIK